MRKANKKHNIAGTKRKCCQPVVLSASATPIITGTAAPARVLGRVASNHAFHEFVFIFLFSVIIYIWKGQLAKSQLMPNLNTRPLSG